MQWRALATYTGAAFPGLPAPVEARLQVSIMSLTRTGLCAL